MKPNKRPRKLQNYLISKDIQLRMVITNFLYLCLISLVLILTVLSPYFYDIFNDDELWVQYLSAKTFIVLLDRLIIALPLIFVISFIHFIVLTHRFCGPMINIKNTMQEVARGNFTRKVYLRKNDFLKEEAATLNHMIDQLSGYFEEIREDNKTLLAMLEEKLDANKHGVEINPILNEVKANAMHTRDFLDKVKIDPGKGHAN
ncbi:MAG: methyl-accepting chemotaxis protein [Proteobacteria bacterium]|nr:methyl-accepting chemotaxis protein [Pseudomonadota bacterium]